MLRAWHSEGRSWWPVTRRLSHGELSRGYIIKFLQNRGSVSFLAEHKLLGNIFKMWPREVTRILVPAYNHVFPNKHFRGTVSKLEDVRSGRKPKSLVSNQIQRDSGGGVEAGVIKTHKHLFLKVKIKPTFLKRKLFIAVIQDTHCRMRPISMLILKRPHRRW